MSDSPKHLYIAAFGPWTKVGISVSPYARVKALSGSVEGKIYRVVKHHDAASLEAQTIIALNGQYYPGGLAGTDGFSSEVFFVSPLVVSMLVDHLAEHPLTMACPKCLKQFNPSHSKQVFCRPAHAGGHPDMSRRAAVTALHQSWSLLNHRRLGRRHGQQVEFSAHEMACLVGAVVKALKVLSE